MNKFKYVFFATLALLVTALPALAQGAGAEAGDNAFSVSAAKAIGGGIGFGLAAGLAGLGQAGTVQTLMIIALALIESLVLFALLIVFVKL
jgi:F0F1-type ATP synthase membrane subunit c/vacuolar-type H+-ATPase subunit K